MSGFAGVALGDMDRHFAWQAWHLWHWVGSGGALGAQAALGRRGVLRGKRGTLWHPPSLCVAGVALDDMDRHFAWQAWHLSTHGSSLCVAGVALMAVGWLWWRAWFPGRAGTAALGRRGVVRGRRGTLWHPPSLCVVGVALDDMDRHFAWQAWHLWHWVGSGGAFRRDGGTCCSCRHFTPRRQTAVTPRPPHTTSHLESFNTPCGEVTFDSTQSDSNDTTATTHNSTLRKHGGTDNIQHDTTAWSQQTSHHIWKL